MNLHWIFALPHILLYSHICTSIHTYPYVYAYTQTSDESMNKETRRRPQINNLFDVFCAVRDDEFEHIKTMTACAEGTIKFSLDKKAASRQN